MIPFLFVGFALLLVASSLLVILHKNPVTSALFLVLAFCSLAGIYLLLHAEFVGIGWNPWQISVCGTGVPFIVGGGWITE